MSSNKTFTVGGTSYYNGSSTWRFANGSAAARAKVLRDNGHRDVDLEPLPRPMTREEAIEYLMAQGRRGIVNTRGDAKHPNRAETAKMGHFERKKIERDRKLIAGRNKIGTVNIFETKSSPAEVKRYTYVPPVDRVDPIDGDAGAKALYYADRLHRQVDWEWATIEIRNEFRRKVVMQRALAAMNKKAAVV